MVAAGEKNKESQLFNDSVRRFWVVVRALDFLMGFRLEKKGKGGREEKKLVVNPPKCPPNEQYFPSFMVFRP